MRILGIDPGTATTGYGLVEADNGQESALTYGVITTPAGLALEQRLLTVHQQLTALMRQFQPEVCAVEELFFGRNTRSAFSVAQSRGVALLAAAEFGLPVAVYRPVQVKQAVAAYGGAAKPQIQHMVRMLLRLREIPKPDDAADALAIALCHAHTAGSLIAQARAS